MLPLNTNSKWNANECHICSSNRLSNKCKNVWNDKSAEEVGKGTNELMSNCQENKKQQENEEELLYDNEKYIHTQNIRTKRGNDDKMWREIRKERKNKYCDRFVAVNQAMLL